MKCSKCGNEYQGNFCPNCGTQAKKEPEQRKPFAEDDAFIEPIVCRKHPFFKILPYSMGVLIVLAAVLMYIGKEYGLGIVFLIFAAVIFLLSYLQDKCEYIELRKDEVVLRKGIINTKKLQIPLNRIQGISVENGLLGKIIGYHTVKIDNAGTGGVEIELKYMGHAEAFVSAVHNAMRRS